MINIFRHCYENASRFGIKALVYDLTYNFLNKIFSYSKMQLMALTLNTLNPAWLKQNAGYFSRYLSETELREYAKDPSNRLDIKFIKEALAKGDICRGVFDRENLASYVWYSNKSTNLDDDLVLAFNNKAWVYGYNGYTKPSYRGRRLLAVGIDKTLKDFSRKGVKGIILCIDTNNNKSLRLSKHLGYRKIGTITAFKVWGTYRFKIEKACEQYDVTLRVRK